MIKEIHEKAKEIIKKYEGLELGGKHVRTPYFINTKRKRDLRALVGKGTPEEIIVEARIWEKLKGISLNKMTDKEVREFLISKGLGIDCSGFVIHVLDYWYFSIKNKHIWGEMKFAPGRGLLRDLKLKIRPAENLGANTITSEINSDPIEIKDVRPGDLIRSKWKKVGTHHVQLITKVQYDESNLPVMIEYTHSTPYYGDTSGVRVGQIRILDPNKPLYDQEWLEKDEHDVNFSYEGFLTQVEDNGLRRVRAMKEIILNEN